MAVISSIQNLSIDIVTLLLPFVVAFVAWILKNLIEKPMDEARISFESFFEKRIQILSELNANLHFIAYFPEEIEYKERLQKIILDGHKSAYISKEIFENIIRIAIDSTTHESLTLDTIQEIEVELEKLVSKIRDENEFYYRYTDKNPLCRVWKYCKLIFMYLLAATLVVIFLLCIGFFIQNLINKF